MIASKRNLVNDPDYMARWLRGACSSGDPLHRALNLVLDDREHLRSERDFYQEMFKDTTEHMAAVHAELGLSYEAETPFVIAVIRKLHVLDPDRGDDKARGVSAAAAADHPNGPPDFDG